MRRHAAVSDIHERLDNLREEKKNQGRGRKGKKGKKNLQTESQLVASDAAPPGRAKVAFGSCVWKNPASLNLDCSGLA